MGGFKKKPEQKVDYAALAAVRAEEERQKNLARQKRGVDSTIKTSYQGVLGQKSDNSTSKKLLGE